MRFKHVPDVRERGISGTDGELPDSDRLVAYVADVQNAVPLVPGTEDDCCARLQRRQGFPSRDVSRTWLTFLRAIDLADETDDGFRRTRIDPTVESLRAGLLDGVLGAAEIATELIDADAERPLTAADGFDAVEDLIPRWERTRTDDWESVWRGRVERLLSWFDALDLAERVESSDGERDDSETTEYVPSDELRALLDSRE